MLYGKVMLISPVLLLLLLQLLVVKNCRALSCLPCGRIKCREIECPGGKVLSVCQCCLICAKQKGEVCGGHYNSDGQCDQGLKCVRKHPKFSMGVCEELELIDDEEFRVWLKTRLEHRGDKRGVLSPVTKEHIPR